MSSKRKEYKFSSLYTHDDRVQFRPMYLNQQEYGIADDWFYGRIVAIRFTKAKVFYDIVDDYRGYLFRDVDSVKVRDGNNVLPTTIVDPNQDTTDQITPSDN